MKVNVYPQVEVVCAKDPMEFKAEFNSKMKDLSENDPTYEFIFKDEKFVAIITYTEKERVMDCVADEFHAEGIRYLCKNCPHLEDPKDKRIKVCGCRYAELGTTHKLHEACEVFYKALKAGTITPIEDYER
jgi:hypothetical protein